MPMARIPKWALDDDAPIARNKRELKQQLEFDKAMGEAQSNEKALLSNGINLAAKAALELGSTQGVKHMISRLVSISKDPTKVRETAVYAADSIMRHIAHSGDRQLQGRFERHMQPHLPNIFKRALRMDNSREMLAGRFLTKIVHNWREKMWYAAAVDDIEEMLYMAVPSLKEKYPPKYATSEHTPTVDGPPNDTFEADETDMYVDTGDNDGGNSALGRATAKACPATPVQPFWVNPKVQGSQDVLGAIPSTPRMPFAAAVSRGAKDVLMSIPRTPVMAMAIPRTPNMSAQIPGTPTMPPARPAAAPAKMAPGGMAAPFTPGIGAAQPFTPGVMPARQSAPQPFTPAFMPAGASAPQPFTPAVMPAGGAAPQPFTPGVMPSGGAAPQPFTPGVMPTGGGAPQPFTPGVMPSGGAAPQPFTPGPSQQPFTPALASAAPGTPGIQPFTPRPGGVQPFTPRVGGCAPGTPGLMMPFTPRPGACTTSAAPCTPSSQPFTPAFPGGGGHAAPATPGLSSLVGMSPGTPGWIPVSGGNVAPMTPAFAGRPGMSAAPGTPGFVPIAEGNMAPVTPAPFAFAAMAPSTPGFVPVAGGNAAPSTPGVPMSMMRPVAASFGRSTANVSQSPAPGSPPAVFGKEAPLEKDAKTETEGKPSTDGKAATVDKPEAEAVNEEKEAASKDVDTDVVVGADVAANKKDIDDALMEEAAQLPKEVTGNVGGSPEKRVLEDDLFGAASDGDQADNTAAKRRRLEETADGDEAKNVTDERPEESAGKTDIAPAECDLDLAESQPAGEAEFNFELPLLQEGEDEETQLEEQEKVEDAKKEAEEKDS
eukprot:TRINITY_DN49121_c0_g1_i1.p1 TRINITY_DN49121_c0_g1~~TRINITY_DN49121_c0_g1_i1.p1  ORF type:complete len:826 (+),score=167.81 TRINITY_DN49121_c0_g1_i1:81-2558(+)